jgi:NADPH:quinone reductase-like Zn-dependent oxidoreductase
MKRRYKITGSIFLVLALVVGGFAIYISHDAACEAASQAPTGAPMTRAVIYTCYGGPDVLQIAELPRPVPGPGEVLIKVHAAAVNPLDWHYMRGSPYVMRLMSGTGRPTEPRLGVDFAGTIEAVGSGVTRFSVSDAVFGGTTGAFGDYVVTGAEHAIAHMPDNVTFAEAAAVPVAGLTALQALRDSGKLAAGDKVLVNGASGGVGPFTVQLAKYFGAEVTGVASGRNEVFVRSLGADHFINYREQNYLDAGITWDVIVDNVGNQPLLDNKKVMQPDGVLVMVGGPPGDWIGPLIRPLSALLLNPFTDPEFAPFLSHLNGEDLEFLADRMAAGELTVEIDKRFPLADIAEAIRYSEEGHARAKIVIDVVGD